MKIDQKHAVMVVERVFDSKDESEQVQLVSGIDGQK